MVNKLRYLLAVAETQNVRQAAQLLGVSPPALSKAIKSLEKEFGFPMLIAHGRGIILSDRAKKLAERAEQIIKLVDELSEKSPAAAQSVLRVSTFEVFSTYFLRLLFAGDLANYSLELRESVPGEMEENVARGLSDYAITYLPVPRAEVKHVEIMQINMGIFGVDGPMVNLPFDQLPFVVPILPVRAAPTKVQGLDGWPDSEFERNVRHQVTLMESALELCRSGVAVGYFPRFVARLYNEERHKAHSLVEYRNPFKMKTRFGVYIAHRVGTPEDFVLRAIAKALRKIREL